MASSTGAVEYVIEWFDSDATFGPNVRQGEIWDARNIGWSSYDRIPGKAFWSLPQTSPLVSNPDPLLTHIRLWRISPTADTELWHGVFIEPNSTGDDVIFDCFDYISLLSLSRAGFKTLYPSKKIGSEVVSPEWTLAKGAGSSPLGFVATGTIENPLDDSGVTDLTTSPEFGTLDQNRLQLFYDLSEIGRANTLNQVTYEIDLTDTFNFWKNKGAPVETAFVLNGTVSDYQYIPGWLRYRNDLATVGTADLGGAVEIVATASAQISAKGLRQDVTTLRTLLGISGSTVVADQQKAALEYQLRKAYELRPALALRLERGSVAPYDGWEINDRGYVEIVNGRDSITGRRRIVGVRAMYVEYGEELTVLVDPIASAGQPPS